MLHTNRESYENTPLFDFVGSLPEQLSQNQHTADPVHMWNPPTSNGNTKKANCIFTEHV